MIERILNQPWVFLGFVLTMLLLQFGAAIRIRHDRKLKQRALMDRRENMRPEKDRRWRARPANK